MNYRHAFHAGNHADILKHAIFALTLAHMQKKPAPFRVLDVFAGIGLYDLSSEAATRSPEWQKGIAALMQAPEPPIALSPLLDIVANLNLDGDLRLYPGSPEIARQMLRRDDRLMLADLHPEDSAILAGRYADDRAVKVECRDGWQAIRAWLPPTERRGVVLIDPPFEKPGEFARLLQALDDGLTRFATGTFVLWHAAKDADAVQDYEDYLTGYAQPVLRAQLNVRSPGSGSGLAASGVVIVNPPWTLEEDLAILLPFLAQHLAQGEGSCWALNRLTAYD